MLLSQTAHYALRAVFFLATAEEDKWHLTKNIAEQTQIPGPYLARILSTLAKRGILSSRTGMGGGFNISNEGLNLTLHDVVGQFDNLDNICNCVFGFAECCGEGECILHKPWDDIKNRLLAMLKSNTLQDLRNSDKNVDWLTVKG
jgi:Rrf2 family protein